MSYDIYLYHSDVKKKVDRGFEIDDFDPPVFLETDVKRFLAGLSEYGYQLESEDEEVQEFVKTVSGCPIQVSVFSSEIAFSVPYGDNSNEAIFEAFKDASVLSDTKSMVLYDPQTEEWVSK